MFSNSILVTLCLIFGSTNGLNFNNIWQEGEMLEFMNAYFHQSCQPKCGNNEMGFSYVTSGDFECPRKMKDFDHGNKDSFALPDDFCLAQVSGSGS